MTDFACTPRETTPDLLVVVDLDGQRFEILSSGDLQDFADAGPVRRPTGPASHDSPGASSLLEDDAEIASLWCVDGSFDHVVGH